MHESPLRGSWPNRDLQPLAAKAVAALIPTLPMPIPMPKVARTPGWQAYADSCLLIKGAAACCVFDLHTAQPLALAGGRPSAERLAQQGAVLLRKMNDASRTLGLGQTRAEASVSTSSHHLIQRPVPGVPGVALHLVISANTGNLTLARMQLQRIELPQ